jgi:deazaflavin-dependent oxidoreductase (nitroreductase family)
MIMGFIGRRLTGWRRTLVRAPILLYRAGLGRLLGHRFVYLVHQGRRSGLRREAVLEVVHYDPCIPEAFVIAAWGQRSNWYRNIAAAPAIEIRIGNQRWPRPRHRFLTAEETVPLLNQYRRHHPLAWKIVAPMLDLPTDPTEPTWQARAATIRPVAFTPRRDSP